MVLPLDFRRLACRSSSSSSSSDAAATAAEDDEGEMKRCCVRAFSASLSVFSVQSESVARLRTWADKTTPWILGWLSSLPLLQIKSLSDSHSRDGDPDHIRLYSSAIRGHYR